MCDGAAEKDGADANQHGDEAKPGQQWASLMGTETLITVLDVLAIGRGLLGALGRAGQGDTLVIAALVEQGTHSVADTCH